MKTLWVRLKMAYQCLTAPRVVVYLPRLLNEESFRSARIGKVTSEDWDGLTQLSEACFTVALCCETEAECARQDAIENEQRQIAAGVRTTRQAELLLAEARRLTTPTASC